MNIMIETTVRDGGNMRFSEYEYIRPDIMVMEYNFYNLLGRFNLGGLEEQNIIVEEINKLRNEFESMIKIANIRHTTDIGNRYYETEQRYINECVPVYQKLVTQYYNTLINSKYREKLEKKWGKQLFRVAETSVKTYSDDILEELELESRLINEYDRIIAFAKTIFNGKEAELNELAAHQFSDDRQIRKRAYDSRYAFFEANESNFDNIFDNLVKVRTRMARKLGCENYIELGYNRLSRTDYDYKMVKNFRGHVKQYMLPLAARLGEKQCRMIGVDKLKYYDSGIFFKTGGLKPRGDAGWIIDMGREIFSELSPETKEFFNYVADSELLDVIFKEGKLYGGYSTFVGKYKAPFIFANFNGTSEDIEVLIHESGHAFQTYCSRDFSVPEYYYPTLEACEIHSMSMELFIWPWIDLFFKGEGERYRVTHLFDSIYFILYSTAIDEFQHIVYSYPDISPGDRKEIWSILQSMYMPYCDFSENEYLKRGGYWQQQGHIFESPFYYIDYALAQICAFQFLEKIDEDRNHAWQDYLKLCRAGGSKSFTELLSLADLNSPFEGKTVRDAAGYMQNRIKSEIGDSSHLFVKDEKN